MTNRSIAQSTRSGSIARWILATLALLFVAGALGQFFLVGLSMFEDGSRWQDHKTLGHMIGLIPYLLWIPAVLGRVGRGLTFGTLMLFVLYMAQYGFINAGTGVMNALHPLNGSILLLLGVWIARRSISLARESVIREARNAVSQFAQGGGRMNLAINVLMGLVVGYLVGIVLAALVAFVLGFEDVARFVAIGSGLLGAALGPSVFGRLRDEPR